MKRTIVLTTTTLLVALAACGREDATSTRSAKPAAGLPELAVAIDSVVPALVEASGIAAPIQQATLSTRLMGAVTAVLVHEGDRVQAGQLLLRLDTRELDAKAEQAGAVLRAAEAQAAEAERYAIRIRALYADSAAPKALLDGAETGVARAGAGLTQAQGAQRELAAVARYGELRAPFAGIVTRRWVDPGAFAAPGAPLLTVEDGTRLRLRVSTTPPLARGLRRGQALESRIEDLPAVAVIEGMVPAQGGGMYTVNAVVHDPAGRFASGGAASLFLPGGVRRVVLVPRRSVVRQGDLTGVRIWQRQRAELRWVRLGGARGELVEVLSGLAGGDSVVVFRDAEGN